jgi:DNA polymerase elongation subunit (family B)
MLDSLQNSKKVALNSVYGAMACPHFFLFNPSIASGITLTGQAIIKFIERRVNIFLNEKLKTNDKDFVILSDTDSIAIRLDELVQKIVPIEKQDDDTITDFIIAFGTKVLNPFIEQCFKEFEEYVNCYDSRLVMKLENIAKASICIAKKNYVMGVRYSEGTRYKEEKLKMMGISVARSSIPEFCKPAIINCIKICLYGTESELQDYIKEFETVYYKASPEEIAMPRSISDIDKWIIDETTWKTGTPIHVKCSIIYNHLIKKLKIANTNIPIVNGAKMKFVYVNEKNLFRNNAIAFTDKYPNEFHDIFEIDYSVMFNKGFLDPVKAFTEVLGWTDKKVFTLDAFF